MKKAAVLLALALLAGALVLWSRRPVTWPATLAMVRERYPDVPTIGTRELAAWLADPARPRPLLLDVRTEDEFRVSRIPGARRYDSVAALPSATPIVAYCSVGLRSAALVRALRESGREARNLEGSIFAWANEGRPLEDDAGPASRVHPFDARWGALLDPARRAD